MISGVFRGVSPGDLEGILRHLSPNAMVIVLWRQYEAPPKRWLYLGRLRPCECELELLQARFGGGWYRAKIYGQWDRRRRREEYLQQVSFGIDGPIGAETREWMRAAALRQRER